MLRELGHSFPIGWSEESEPLLVDTRHPGIEPMPEFDDEREKDGAVKAFTVAPSVPGFPLRAVA